MLLARIIIGIGDKKKKKKKKAEWKDMKIKQFDQKRSPLKVVDKEDMVVKEISAIKKRYQILCPAIIRKMPLVQHRNLSDLPPSQDQGCKNFNSFEKLCFEKTAPVPCMSRAT
jgi:hypothetical protein